MSLPRFRIRTLAIAVAVVALILGGYARLDKRRQHLKRKAVYHQNAAIRFNFESATANRPPVLVYGPDWSLREADRHRLFLLAEHHFTLAKKYEEASKRPWFPVPPDPPAPK